MSSSAATSESDFQAAPVPTATYRAMDPNSPRRSSFIAAQENDVVPELTQNNLQEHTNTTTASLRRAINNSVYSAAEWLENMSTATKSEFGDIDPAGEDNGELDAFHDKLEAHSDPELRRPTLPMSPRDYKLLQSPATPPVHTTTTPPVASTAPRRKELSSRLKVILDDQTLFSMYKRLMYLALIVNIVLLVLLCTDNFSAANGKAPLIAVINVFLCVLFRNEAFFRIVFWATVRLLTPAWIPVQIKWWVTSFLQSVGGLHSGAGMSSVLWMIKAIYDMSGNEQLANDAMVVLAYLIAIALVISCVGAFPVVRHLFHNTFEFSHRMAGWGSLALLWGFVIVAARHSQTLSAVVPRPSMRDTLEDMPEYWLAIGLTILVILPWLSVRRVRVEFSTPSNHASLIRFPGPVKAGYLGRISRSPLADWHAFGIISDNRFTHTILAGAVGDFTKKLVQEKPEYLYTRSVKFAGLPYLIHMYQRVLLVATGSGLCPFMSFLLQESRPDVFVIWVGKNLRQNFGDELVDGVEAYPADKRIVRDTAIHARPNILDLTIATARARKSEVVIVTSNPVGTRDIVNGCRKAGIAAYGPIWDS